MGYVYKITNTLNNKSYIGISIHEPEKHRIKDHLSGRGNRIIARAVKKYGKDAFTYEVLEANVFDEFLPELEVAYIAHFNTVAPHGYNLDSGGSHKIPSEETRRKISEAKRGQKHSEEHRRKNSESKKGKKRKPHSAETRRKMSEVRKGNPNYGRKGEKHHFFGKTHSAASRRKMSEATKGQKHSEETRRKISDANKGKTPSEETRRKISEARKGQKHPNFGKALSVETRRKISEANKGKMRNPDYMRVHALYLSLHSDMPIPEKRRCIRIEFPNLAHSTLYRWMSKWESDRKTAC